MGGRIGSVSWDSMAAVRSFALAMMRSSLDGIGIRSLCGNNLRAEKCALGQFLGTR